LISDWSSLFTISWTRITTFRSLAWKSKRIEWFKFT